MVPKPTVDLSGFRKAIVKYQDAVTMSRAFLLALRAEVHLEGQEGPGESRALLIQMATGFWTEHSERGTMATYMQMSHVAPENSEDGWPLVVFSRGRVHEAFRDLDTGRTSQGGGFSEKLGSQPSSP